MGYLGAVIRRLVDTKTVKLNMQQKMNVRKLAWARECGTFGIFWGSKYQYKGGDNGITYKYTKFQNFTTRLAEQISPQNWHLNFGRNMVYFHSPIAEYIASKLPRTLAPNVVTLIAAMFLVIPHLLTWKCITLGNESDNPKWSSLIVGVCFMVYITLDNVDGKQARRLGVGSPLGQIFDHGLDAMTLNLGLINMARYYYVSDGYLPLVLILIGTTGYFMYNIREYYIGEYFLPIFNPISEGSLIDFAIYCVAEYAGYSGMSKPLLFGLRGGDIFVILLALDQVNQNSSIYREIISAKTYEIPFISRQFWVQMSSYLLIVMGSLGLVYTSPTSLGCEGDRAILYIAIFQTSMLVLHLQIGHLSGKEFRPYSVKQFVLVCPETGVKYGDCVLYGLSVYLILVNIGYFISIVRQLEDTLRIKCFKVQKPFLLPPDTKPTSADLPSKKDD